VDVDDERLLFSYQVEGSGWQLLPQQFDASILSDEATAPGLPNFTGAFVGMACQDTAGTGWPADFDYFDYQEREYCVSPFTERPSAS
jgi:xylan 1,4-beta-xylosidase